MGVTLFGDQSPINPVSQATGYEDLGSGAAIGTAAEEAIADNPTAEALRTSALQQTGLGPIIAGGRGGVLRAAPESPLLQPEAANTQFGIKGTLSWDKPVRLATAQLQNQYATERIQRADVLNRADSGILPATARIAATLGASALDPINIAASFVPVVGEARFARLGVVGARIARGAVEGAAGQALIEPIALQNADAEQRDYDMYNSLTNIAMGAGLGAVLHTAGGFMHDRLFGVPEFTPPQDHADALSGAIAALSEDRPTRVAEYLSAVDTSRRQGLLNSTAIGNVGSIAPTTAVIDNSSANFREWFGNSRAAGDDSRPTTLFHGTQADISHFDPTLRGDTTEAQSARKAFFFTDNPDVAGGYAAGGDPYNDRFTGTLNRLTGGRYGKVNDFITEKLGMVSPSQVVDSGANIIPVYAKMENPLVHDFAGKDYRERSFSSLIDEAKTNGHDGVIFKNVRDPGFDIHGRDDIPSNVYAVFQANQVKSIFNSGAFSGSDSLSDMFGNAKEIRTLAGEIGPRLPTLEEYLTSRSTVGGVDLPDTTGTSFQDAWDQMVKSQRQSHEVQPEQATALAEWRREAAGYDKPIAPAVADGEADSYAQATDDMIQQARARGDLLPEHESALAAEDANVQQAENRGRGFAQAAACVARGLL